MEDVHWGSKMLDAGGDPVLQSAVLADSEPGGLTILRVMGSGCIHADWSCLQEAYVQ